MERVRHARIPVHLNAVLIGEKTVPKGCKVRNVSDQGMLLTCHEDGRTLTFRDGDHVDIHLLFQRHDGTKYSTISAIVRHVAANGIGVEFNHPDARLIDLIESYRIDETRVLGATISPRQKAAGPDRPEAVVNSPAPVIAERDDRRQPPVEVSSRRYYYLGLLSLAMAFGIITAGYLGTTGLGKRMTALEVLTQGGDSELNPSQSQPPADGDISGNSNDRKTSLESDTSDPASEGKRTVDTPPSGATPAPLLSAGIGHEEETPTAVATEPPGNTGQETSLAIANGPAADKRGHWVINLLSSPSKAEADRFAERARKQGIPVEQNSVWLKGREYFRVQLTGFKTAKQANDNAGPVKERLGVNDVWIFKP